MRALTLRTALALSLLVAVGLITGCGSTITSRCATTVEADGSGSRTLTFVVSREDIDGQEVDMEAVPGKLAAAKPEFATLTDESSSSAYTYVLSFDFTDPEDFQTKAAWFGSTPALSVHGGVFSPTVELTEAFVPESWFEWALQATDRSGSDIADVEYEVTLPSAVEDLTENSNGQVAGDTYSATGLSYSSDLDVHLRAQQRYDVHSFEIHTTAGKSSDSRRTVTYRLTAATAEALVASSGGQDSLLAALEAWAGAGWASAAVTDQDEFVLTLTKSGAIDTLGTSRNGSSPPAVRTTASPNRYLATRVLEEDVKLSAWFDGDVWPLEATYELMVPWLVENSSPPEGRIGAEDGSITWDLSSGSIPLRVQMLEVRTQVLNTVIAAAAVVTAAALALAVFALLRVAVARKPV